MDTHETSSDDRIRKVEKRTDRLEYAVFGVDGKRGMIDMLDQLDSRLGKTTWALVTAALSLAAGSVAVVITTLVQAHS